MTVFKGTGFYHVGATNTNRIVDILVAVANNADAVFAFLKGNNAFHPWIGQNSAPTTNDKIAQYRVDYIVRYLSIYAIPVGLRIVDMADFGGSNTANGLIISYETYVSNVFPDVTDIVDAYGLADRSAKTKDGLQTLADNCTFNASLDGGSTKLFAVNPHLSDGTVSTSAAIGTAASSLVVTLQTPSMY